MKIEVEIGLEMVIPELQKLPEFEENYWDYYNIYELMVEVCNLFDDYQDYYITKFNGEDDTFYLMLEYTVRRDSEAYGFMFSTLWEKFLPTINFSSLLEKHSIVDNSKNIDYLYEPECELRREY